MAETDSKQQASLNRLITHKNLTIQQGTDAFKLQDYPAALQHFTDAQSKEPDNPIHYLNKAMVELKLKQ